MGGTMRLGLRPTVFDADSDVSGARPSAVRKLYGGAPKIWERHRHRYEVNPEYIDRLVAQGLRFVGRSENGERMQVLELPGHPYFVGFQAHPEFCTRPLNPSPPFLGFVAAAAGLARGAGLGDAGLVWANVGNLALRAAYAWAFARRFFRERAAAARAEAGTGTRTGCT